MVLRVMTQWGRAPRLLSRLAGAAILAALLIPGGAAAQSLCASGTVRLVVPFPAGGPVDTAARVLSAPLQKHLNRTVVIENRGGASGSLGTAHVAQQPGDGCTVLMAYDTHGVNPVLLPNMPFDTLKDLRSVMLLGTIPNVVTVHASRPWKTFDELIAAARKGSPELNYGTGGNGTLSHLATKLLEKEYGVRMRHVPFRGGGPMAQAVLGNHIDLGVGSVLALAPLVREGSIRALAQTGAKRHPLMPDVPTVAEMGSPNFSAVSWIGVFLPAEAPEPVAGELFAALQQSIAEKDVKDRMAAVGIELLGSGRSDLDKFLVGEIARWREVIEANGIRPD